jgi:hypothetical protein
VEIIEIKSRLGITEVLSHYGLSADKNNNDIARIDQDTKRLAFTGSQCNNKGKRFAVPVAVAQLPAPKRLERPCKFQFGHNDRI